MDKRQQKIDSFIYPVVTEQDYVLGAERSAPFEVINPSGDWRPYLPIPEVQRKDGFDSNSCTSFGTLNIIETLENFQRNLTPNYSERFSAIMGGQKRNGADPHNILEGIRSYGVLDEDILPFKSGMPFEEYMSMGERSSSLIKEAKTWEESNVFKHEYIYTGSISLAEKKRLLTEALKRSPVGVSVYAWQKRGDVYVKPKGQRDTHWCVLVAIEDGKPIVFDSYAPHLKTLSWEHFDVAKGVYLKYEPNKQKKILSIFTPLIETIKELITMKRPVYPIKKKLFIDRLSQGWGVRNPLYKSGIHMGADFAVPTGTPIYAPHDGEIYVAGKSSSLGNYCFYRTNIDEQERFYVFMHLQNPVEKGIYTKGQQIGLCGNTGTSTGAHLHLESWIKDPVNVKTRYAMVLREKDIRMYTRDPYKEFRYLCDGVII